MGIYKRGDVYWYRVQWKGKSVRESTKQTNDKIARQMEAAHRTSLAKGEVGIRDKKRAPTLVDFADKQFLPWAESTFSARPKTWLYYRNGVRRLKDFTPLASHSARRSKARRKSFPFTWQLVRQKVSRSPVSTGNCKCCGDYCTWRQSGGLWNRFPR